MADVNKVANTALETAPSPIKRLLSSIKPVFSTYSGATQGVGVQPTKDDPIAGVPLGSPNQVLITNTDKFNQSPRQVALHESVHTIQNNLTPDQQKQIPPDVGDPTVVTNPDYLDAQRKAGKTILDLPKEQWSYLAQYHDSKQEEYEKGWITKKEWDQVQKTYGPWIKDFDKLKLSTVIPTDPKAPGNTINTTMRPPLVPVMQQATTLFDPANSSVPTTTTGGNDTTKLAALAKPVSWDTTNPAGMEGIEKPITSVRPSKQNAPVAKPKYKVNPGDDKSTRPFTYKINHDFFDKDPSHYQKSPTIESELVKARIASVEDPKHKNPFSFTHPLDQQAATFAKVQRILKNQEFKSFPKERQQKILSNYYDKYVTPVYTHAGLAPPHKDIWINQVQKTGPTAWSVKDFYVASPLTTRDAASDAYANLEQAGAAGAKVVAHVGHFLSHEIALAGVMVDRKELGIANFFPGSALQKWAQDGIKEDEKLLNKPAEMSQGLIDDITFWQDTHPTRTYQEKASAYVGEVAVQLPLYEGLKAIQIGMMGKAIAVAGTQGKAANFTRALMTSKVGGFAARRLTDAADSYTGDIFSETPKGDRAKDMAAYMGWNTLTEGFGALAKPIAKRVMKKVMAVNIATGGKIFNDTVADQAAHELENDIIGTNAAGEPIHHDPKDPNHFENAMQHSADSDPVKHKVVTAAKITHATVARELYGKPTNQLSKLQRRKVRVTVAQMANEAAIEMPIHVPEVSKHEIETKLKADVATNPGLANTFNDIEKQFGIPVVQAVHETEVESIKAEQGIKSTQGATEKVAKNNKTAEKSGIKPNIEPIKLKTDAELEALQPKPVTKTRAELYFAQFGDRGNMKYFSGDQGYDVKFDSPVDKILYTLNSNTKTAIRDRKFNMDRLFKYFGGEKTPAQIYEMAGKVKTQLDAAIRERRTDFYKDPKLSDLRFPKMFEISPEAEEVMDYNKTMAPYKANFFDQYTAGLKELAKLQQLRKATQAPEAKEKITVQIREEISRLPE